MSTQMVSSPLLGCSGGAAAATTVQHVPNVPNAEHYLIGDDSDTSDDESDDGYDNHPDPFPADPDMAGWSSNQIGCYLYGKYKQ